MATTTADVVILGAGIAGLATAYYIHEAKPDLNLLVLEAKDRIGGRTLTKTLNASGNATRSWDLGGQWVGTSQPRIIQLLKDFEMETYPQHTIGKNVCELGAKLSTYEGDLPAIGPLSLLDLNSLIKKFETLATNHSVKNKNNKEATQLDSQSIQAFVDKNTWFADTRLMTASAFRTICGIEMSKTSALYAAILANSSGGFTNLIEDKEFGAQGLKVKGGTQQISQKLRESIGTSNVRTSTAVIEIDQSNAEAITIVTTKGEQITCKLAVSTIPINMLNKLNWTPSLPAVWYNLFQGCPVGHYIKYVITYETRFWVESGYSGMAISADAPPTNHKLTMAPITCCYDATDDNDTPALVVFSAAGTAQELDSLSKEERHKAIVDHLCRLFNNGKARSFIEIAEKNWRLEPFNGGCPGTVPPCGYASLLLAPELKEPLDRVYFGGTEFATEWIGYMEGALETAQRVSSQVLQRLDYKNE